MVMILFTILFVLVLTVIPLHAQWSNDPNVNNAICTAANDQLLPQVVSDGAGGAIITWYDERSYPPLNYDIYAQRISGAGVVQWTADGIIICAAINDQPYPTYPTIASDGAGGAIITWQDYRSGSSSESDIYAQCIDSNGVVQWDANGVAICTFSHNQVRPQIVSDNSGGAIITWADLRNGTDYDIYAQRINSSGVTQWTVVGGVPICVITDNQSNPKIAGDGAGGAIITWEDRRNNNSDIYAQYIDNAGVVHMGTNGVAVCSAANSQQYPNIVKDDSGGAIITWEDLRNSTDYNIYAQHIDVLGNVYWGTNGTAICSAANNQLYPTLVSDGSGGAIITWEDIRNSSDYSIYAQRINIFGTVQWSTDGTAICTDAADQNTPKITGDGSGGAIITWNDYHNGSNYDIYVQNINSSGLVQWTTNGVAVCTVGGTQYYPSLVNDGAGGSIITWEDNRNGNNDIYASRVFSDGALPVTLSSFSAQVDPSVMSVLLKWKTVTEVDNYGFEVELYESRTNHWNKIGFVAGAGNSNSPKYYEFVDRLHHNGAILVYKLKQIDNNGSFSYSNKVEVDITPKKFVLYQNYPNPFNPTTKINYSIPAADPDSKASQGITLKIYDILGREVRTLVSKKEKPGNYEVEFNASKFASGIYFYELKTKKFRSIKKMILLH
jgi:predicted lipoprotein with Yx(FWY)xxD motif